MCLETGWQKPRIAKEDITVYKLLSVETQGLSEQLWIDGKIQKGYSFILKPQSYNSRKIYEFGKLNRVNAFSYYRNGRITHVDRGYHSFANRQNALNLKGRYTMAVECKIPKGTEYWKGTNNGSSDGYCSKKLIVVREILS